MPENSQDAKTGQNDQLILIVGYSSTGKSASLRNIRNQENWLYLNTEAGKRLPFKGSKFQSYRISDPNEVLEGLDYAISEPTIEGVIIDSLTFLMDMYESQYVINAANTMKAWSNFAQYFKGIMQDRVIRFNRPVIFTAHVADVLNEKDMEMRTSVPVKGSLGKNGIEAYFSTVVAAKRVQTKELAKFPNPLLTITEKEKELGFKHVFQTSVTKTTTGERIRSPMGMFDDSETYVDNDAQMILDRLSEYYTNY